MILVLLVLSACNFSAATDVQADDTGVTDTADPAGDDTGDSGADSGDTGADTGLDPAGVDDDGDGWTENDGDCDDAEPTVHPDADDTCDAIDQDCDGEIDEDAWREDPYEPNDDRDYDLGAIADDPDQALQAALHNDGDIDRYAFTFDDSGWSLFKLDVSLGSIPDGATYRLVVENVTTGVEYFSDYGGGSLSVQISDTVFDDEGGTWRVTVDSLGGADCDRRYLLTVSFSE